MFPTAGERDGAEPGSVRALAVLAGDERRVGIAPAGEGEQRGGEVRQVAEERGRDRGRERRSVVRRRGRWWRGKRDGVGDRGAVRDGVDERTGEGRCARIYKPPKNKKKKLKRPRTGFGGEKERTRHAGALAEDEDGVVGRGPEGADVPLGAPAVVAAQPERLVEQRADGAGLVEAAPGAEAGREGVRGRRDDEGVVRRRGRAGLGGSGEIREDVGGIDRIRERGRGFEGRGEEDGLVRGRVGEERVVGECEVEGRGGIGERDLEERVVWVGKG